MTTDSASIDELTGMEASPVGRNGTGRSARRATRRRVAKRRRVSIAFVAALWMIVGLQLASLTGAFGDAQPLPAAAPKILLYGDSLAFESRDYFDWTARANGWDPVNHVFGGTAPCDWTDDIDADLATRPAVVVIAFSGNSITPCMIDPETGEHFRGARLVEKYRVDVSYLAGAAAAAGARPFIVGTPVPADGRAAELHDLYQEVATEIPPSQYLDGGFTIAPGGVYTQTMPCLPDEDDSMGCINDAVRVRADDGLHLCPTDAVSVDGGIPECPVYSSGARRYGELLASPTAA